MSENPITINETNRMIHEFMEAPINYWYQNNELTYHHDWGKLMPVVEKIEAIIQKGEYGSGNRIVIEDRRCIITEPFIDIQGSSKIDATYSAVCKFISQQTNVKA